MSGQPGFVDTKDVKISKEALIEMGKIKPKQWKSMGEAFAQMRDFMDTGGLSVERMFGGPINVIKQQIETTILGMFSPLINEITSLIGKLVDEGGLMDALAKVAANVGNIIDAVGDIDAKIGDTNFNLLDTALDGLSAFMTGGFFGMFIGSLNLIMEILEAFPATAKTLDGALSSLANTARIIEDRMNRDRSDPRRDPHRRPGYYLPDDEF
jgi:hypothetical protein